MSDVPLDNATLLELSEARARAMAAHDPEIAAIAPLPEALAALQGARHAVEAFARACERYADRPALGARARELVRDPASGRVTARPLARFETISYAALWRRVVALASGWRAAGLAEAGTLVGICGFGSPEFVIAELACLYLGAVSVPLQTTLAPADLARIIQDAGIGCLVASRDQLAMVADLVPDCPSVTSLGAIDWIAEDAEDAALFRRVQEAVQQVAGPARRVWTLPEIEALGRAGAIAPMAVPAEGDDPLVTLIYTSGSTGLPKGAMYPDSLWLQTWLRGTRPGRWPLLPTLTVSYLPMNHFMGRGAIVTTLARGGTALFTLAPDMSTLFEDLRLARPTVLSLVPRVAEMIHQHFQLELIRRGGGETQGDAALEEAVIEEMRASFLGDRLLLANIGSAPTAPEVLAFLRRCFRVPILEGYGSTEAGVITYENRLATDAIEAYKLIDAPEAGYLTTDRPFPRGQLLIKSRGAIPGYYRSPEASRALYDADGYLRTGDVVEDRGNGELIWIGRAKDVLKLSQGEFVTLWRIESALASGGPLIKQVYLHGRSDRAYLVGVIVPDREAVGARLASERREASAAEVKRLLRAEIDRVAASQELRPYEIPRDFLVEWTPFSKENGLLTETSKIARLRLKARYGERLEGLYAALERNQLREVARLARAAGAPVAERLRAAVQATLGLPDVDMDRRFTDLGGDSLAAVQLAGLLQELSGLRVPEAQILDPGLTLARLARAIEEGLAVQAEQAEQGQKGQQGQPAGARPSVEAIHGADARVIRAADLTIDRFLDPQTLTEAAGLTYAAPPERRRACLLTGANGFLGRFLTLALLERLPDPGGKLYCIVRAPDDAAAEQRLRAVFERGALGLREHFEALQAGRLVVLAGDLMKPRLGLSEETFERLAGELDAIVHNGALVNHAYSYQQLFAPNVLGTVEVIKLAMRRKLKAVAYVSTVGVASGAAPGGRLGEDVDPRALWPERPADSGYAVGYATSKWAGEVLLRDMQARTGAPVAVFRPTMILTPARYPGEINAPDLFVRLLAGLVYTGVAPGSFYAPVPKGSDARPAFDGLPADFIAEAIAAVTVAMAPGWRLYHAADPDGNAGLSLDTVVNWVVSAGYPIERIPDHAAWYRAFGDRLRALDAEKRQHSPLPILYSWQAPERPERQARLDNTRFRAAARDLLHVEALPHLSEALVHRTLAGMIERGLIPPPPGGRPRLGTIIWSPAEAAEAAEVGPSNKPGPPGEPGEPGQA